MKIEMVIPIIPIAQRRPRVSARGKFARVYKSKEQINSEHDIMMFLAKYKPSEPIKEAVVLDIDAYLPVPQSKSKKWKELANSENILPTVKPDLDNLIKNILDCIIFSHAIFSVKHYCNH